ncbi:MAG: BON domain-containing protein, partial [Usitatibacter sp.]
MSKTLSLVFAALVVSGSGVAFAAPPDGWITTKAKIALVTHEGVPSADIHVDTVNGLITLHGKVATIEEKQSAEDAAKTVDGSVGVRNLLQVVPSSEKKWVKRSDKLIQGEI